MPFKKRLSIFISNNRFAVWVLAFLLSLYLRFVYFTKRKIFVGLEKIKEVDGKTSCIPTVWHSRSLITGLFYKKEFKHKLVGIFSSHRDGRYIAKIYKALGLEAVYGSSTRNTYSAVRSALRVLKQDKSVGITPDGPQGPRYSFQNGVMYLAKMSGKPILPLVMSSSRVKLLNTWDRFMFLLPFGKMVVEVLDPIYVGRGKTDDELEAMKAKIRDDMITKTLYWDKEMGLEKIGPSKMKKDE
jgi:hypothetical protein